MLFLLLKNAKDSSYSGVNLFDAGTGHSYNKYFDGKRGGSHEMLVSDVCHDYHIQKVILIK